MSLPSQMMQQGLWQSFDRQVVALEPVLQGMSDMGVPVDPDSHKAMVALLKADMEAAKVRMQDCIPEKLRKVKVYKKSPKVISEAHFQADEPCSICGGTGLMMEEATCVKCNGSGHHLVWKKAEVWKPSNQALVAYMKFKRHPVPTHATTGKETTLAIELARLYRSTKDLLYKAVIDYRKAQTCLTNHVKNWKPGPDGRVHPVFYCDPATAQLSARRPNTQNAPHHDDPEFGGYAETFRSMIKARPEHSIVELDFHSFHVQTLAFEAEDTDMLRLAKLDIHSFVTAHFLHLNTADKMIAMKDDELREYMAWVKKNHKHTRNAQVKHAFLGYNNGMGYNKLYKQYMEFFNNMTEAKNVLQLLDHLFPKTKRYRDAICLKAHEQGYLISRHGHIRYFYEVFRMKWVGDNMLVMSHGDDHEAALCYFTQNDAHCELRDRMVMIHEQGLDTRYNMMNTIHDSLMFEWPNKLLDEIPVVKGIMELGSKVLINSICPNGLSVEAEPSFGPDWAHMQEWKG